MIPEDLSLVTEPKDIEELILKEDNLDDLKDIVDIFNINLKKRDLIRNSKLSEAQDKIVNQIISRVEDRPDNFSNDDLLKYYKTVQETLSKTNTSLDDVKAPAIQVNQQINVVNDEFDRESRKRIVDTVNKILQLSKESSKEIDEIVEVEEGDLEITNG